MVEADETIFGGGYLEGIQKVSELLALKRLPTEIFLHPVRTWLQILFPCSHLLSISWIKIEKIQESSYDTDKKPVFFPSD